jgi:hypothetical protein
MKISHSLGAGLLSATSILARRVAFPLLFLGAGLVLVQPSAHASGTFVNTGSLATAHDSHTATLLPNGKVLVAGGVNGPGDQTATAIAELYDPASGTWTATGSLVTARYVHSATLLPNGKVLVAGGFNDSSGYLASAELYDPASGIWTATGSLATARLLHTATLLPNGQVLVAGGSNGSSNRFASAELYDPASGTWTATGSLATARLRHTATLLPNGQVLVTGGVNSSGVASASAELYDPASGSWAATGNLAAARIDHTATLLPNGQVLVAGGNDGSNALASAELYVGATPTPTPTPTPTILGNISTRLLVETGDNVLFAGFIITGTQPKKVIVRALGPSLPLAGKLANPVLELHGPGAFATITNDNWRSDQQAEIIATGIPPTNDLESAIVATLPANNSAYTAIVRGVNNSTGIAVVEAYDLDHTVDSKLGNIATRGLVQTGDNVLIAGTIVLGQTSQNVIILALGPSLGIPGELADPTLELRDANGGLIASNDNWRTDQEAEIIATGIPPSSDLESAIVATLPANGALYTAIVRGVNGTTGVAVVEVFALN